MCVFADGKPIMYEETFLQNIAAQNFDQHLVQAMHPNPVKVGNSQCLPISLKYHKKVAKSL